MKGLNRELVSTLGLAAREGTVDIDPLPRHLGDSLHRDAGDDRHLAIQEILSFRQLPHPCHAMMREQVVEFEQVTPGDDRLPRDEAGKSNDDRRTGTRLIRYQPVDAVVIGVRQAPDRITDHEA